MPLLPPFLERNLQAQALLPAQRPLVDYFKRRLAQFQDSAATFQVICTAPPQGKSALARYSDHESPLPALIRPAKRPRTLVVFDSSFNPPTLAHLRMTLSALRAVRDRQGGQDTPGEGPTMRLVLLLAINNADKAPKPAAFEQRLAMMWAFAKDVQQALTKQGERSEDQNEIDKIPIDVALSTHPYFSDKSAAIAEADFYNPEDIDSYSTEQVILAGYDTLIRIFNPKYYGAPDASDPPMRRALAPFLARARLRITMRTDDEWGGKEEQIAYANDLVSGNLLEEIGGDKAWAERIELVEGRAEGERVVSSTLAREAAGKKRWEELAELVPSHVKEWVEIAELYSE